MKLLVLHRLMSDSNPGRRMAFLIGMLLLSGAAFAAGLVRLEVTPAEKAELARQGTLIYRELPGALLLPLEDARLELLRAQHRPLQVLDPVPADGDYFLVFRARAGRYRSPAPALWQDDRRMLVRLTETAALAAKAEGFEMVRLHAHPLPAAETEPAFAAPLADSLIQRLVSAISLDSMMRTMRELVAYRTRYTYSRKCDTAAWYIGQRFSELGYTPEYDIYRAGAQRDTSYNVVATWPGVVKPESVVIICGHFDSYSDVNPYQTAPGADDNATGTAALIEAARVMQAQQFRWTVKFVAFSGEEQWMLGSTHWVDSVVVRTGMKVAGVYNTDMFCYTAYDTNLMYVECNTASRSLAVLAESANAQYSIGLQLVNYLDEDCAGDNTPFWEHGIKAVFVAEDSEWGVWNGSNPYYHTPQDTIANMRPGQLLRGTQLAIACLATMATPWTLTAVGESPRGNGDIPSEGCPHLLVRPNPFVAFARVSGREKESFTLYDPTGRPRGENRGDRIGQGLPAGVYFVRGPGCSGLTRVLKLR